MKSFLEFAKEFASDTVFTEPIVVDRYFTDDDPIVVELRDVIDFMNNEIDPIELDKICIKEMQEALSDTDAVTKALKTSGYEDVPNYILAELAKGLYNAEIQNLNPDEQAIIKTLAVYIIVSVQGKESIPKTHKEEPIMQENARKAHLTEIPVRHARISSSDVVEHLAELLGFNFDCDFALWDNRADWEKPMTTNKCYVIMRAVFRPEDITIRANSADYATQVLMATGAGTQFREDVVETLKPFMFPENMPNVRQMPEKIQQLAEQGIAGSRLEELMRRPRIFYDQVNNRYGLYLRPERIIYDIVRRYYGNAEGKFNGVMAFGYVAGDNQNAAAITWGVNVYENLSATPSGVTIDAVFNGIKA